MPDIVYRSGVKSGVIKFKVSKAITRPADTTQYAVSDLINAASATGLIEIDFGTEYANEIIVVDSIQIVSSNGTAGTKLSAAIYMFNSASVLGAADAVQKDDNSAFAPTNAQVTSKLEASFEDISNVAQIGTGVYSIMATEKAITATLNASGKIFAAIVANNAYTPANAEVLTIVFKGYILG